MAIKEISIKIPEGSKKPVLCEDGDDFVLLLFALTKTITQGGLAGLPNPVVADGLRVMLTEYLGCVAQGYIRPYLQDDIDEDTVKVFRNMILVIKQQAIRSGVKMNEKNGKLRFDQDDLDVPEEHRTVIK